MLVAIYVEDALRPDHMSCYGYSRKTTPNIERFCNDSVVFENAYAQSTWTRTSAASMLSSYYPTVLGMEGINSMFRPLTPTLSTVLRRNGFYTLGISANPNVSSYYGFDYGFNKFIDLFLEKNIKKSYVSTPQREKVDRIKNNHIVFPYGEAINNYLKSILKKKLEENKNVFLFVWAIDTHEPFNPPHEFRKFSHQNKRKYISVSQYKKLKSLEDRKELVNLYDDEVFYADNCFGEFIQILKELEVYDESLVVFTSDHGQMLLEHGLISHGHIPYEQALRIPLIIKFPYKEYSKRIKNRVGLIDLFPTVLDFLRLKSLFPLSLDGKSLMSIIRGEDCILHENLFSDTKSWHMQAGFYSVTSSDNWKYIIVIPPEKNIKYYQEMIHHFTAIENMLDFLRNPLYFIKRQVRSKKEFLFDLSTDIFETHDLSRQEPEKLRMMRNTWKRWYLLQKYRKLALTKINKKIMIVKNKLKRN